MDGHGRYRRDTGYFFYCSFRFISSHLVALYFASLDSAGYTNGSSKDYGWLFLSCFCCLFAASEVLSHSWIVFVCMSSKGERLLLSL